MLKNLSLREKIIKVILLVLVILFAIIIFPKNYKIAVSNYDGQQTMVTMCDAISLEEKETPFIFGKGNFFITPITKGPVKELIVKEKIDYVDDVTAYYGSVRISDEVSINAEGQNTRVIFGYSYVKIALMMVLYALLSIAIVYYLGTVILRKNIKRFGIPKINITIKDAFLFGGISVIYAVVAYLTSVNQLIRWIYPLEIAFSAVALFMILCVEKQLTDYLLGTAISSIPIAGCLAVSVNKICAYTFVDGYQALMEQVEYATDSLRHWEKNSARLNYILMGLFERFNFIGKLEGPTPAKVIHWFLGIILLTYIVWFITNKLLKEGSKPFTSLRFTIVFLMIVTYSNTICALKNYNYDLFSLTFGIIAFIQMVYASRIHSKEYAMSAVIFATLGALEKMIIWPTMLICMVAYVVISSYDKEKKIEFCAKNTIKATGVTVLASMLSNLVIQKIVKNDIFPNYKLKNLIQPLQGQFSNLMKLFKVVDLDNTNVFLFGFLIQSLCVFIAAIVLISVSVHIKNHKKECLVIYRIVSIGMVGVIVAAIFRTRVHFEGIIDRFVEAVSTEITTLNTMFFVLLILLFLLWRKSTPHKELFAFMWVLGLILPMANALVDASNIGRYFNYYGLLLIVCWLLIVLDAIDERRIIPLLIGTVVYAIVTIIEMIPYFPSFLYYMPLWDIHTNGREFFSAGTERLLVGEEMIRLLENDGELPDDVVLYFNYGGEWNACPKDWECTTFLSDGLYSLGDYTAEDIEYGDNVYYVFLWGALRRDRYLFYPMPDSEIEPFLNYKIRGRLVGNVYRSEDLRPYFEEVFANK